VARPNDHKIVLFCKRHPILFYGLPGIAICETKGTSQEASDASSCSRSIMTAFPGFENSEVGRPS
jgi:hypothetical protein